MIAGIGDSSISVMFGGSLLLQEIAAKQIRHSVYGLLSH